MVSIIKRSIMYQIFIILVLSSTLFSKEFESRVKVNFKKLSKFKIKEKINVDINFEAKDDIDDVNIEVILPSDMLLIDGKVKQKFKSMSNKEKYKLSLKFSLKDSINDKITIKIDSKKQGLDQTDYADLYVISYNNEVELLTQAEVGNQSKRYWKAKKLKSDIPIIPISYDNNFIQIEPEDLKLNDSINFNFDPNLPFVLKNTDSHEGSYSDTSSLSKLSKTSSFSVSVSGYILFLDSENNWRPLVNCVVEIWDDDDVFDDYLGATTTNSSGYFSKNVSGSDGLFNDDIEVYLQIKAKNSKVAVYEPISAEPYRWFSNTVNTSGGSINFGNIGINIGGYGACSIFHWLNESWSFTSSNGYSPGYIPALFPNSSGTYYSYQTFPFSSYGAIYIEPGDWYWSDEDITRHEYGHAVMHHAQNKWMAPNSSGSHSMTGTYHQNLAWSEGWATAFGMFVDSDRTYSGDGWNLSIESPPSYIPDGHTNEVRVAAALLDLYDNSNEGNDEVTYGYSSIINTIRNNNNDNFIEFWSNFKNGLNVSNRYYASKTIRYNTIDVSLEPLPTPSNLVATASSLNCIDLTWSDNSTDEEGYKVERKTSVSGSWSQIASLNPNITSYSNSDLFISTENYYYRVRSYIGDTYSAYSNIADASTSDIVSILGPSILDFKEQGTWTANPSGGTYEWKYRNNGVGDWSNVVSTSSSYSRTMCTTDFELQVKVTKNGNVDYATRYVRYMDGIQPYMKDSVLTETILPNDFKLHQNYPNPFNPSTNIRYEIPNPCMVTINIYNLSGKKISTLISEYQTSGYYSISWNAKDSKGNTLPSGIYFYEFRAGSFRKMNKLTVFK